MPRFAPILVVGLLCTGFGSRERAARPVADTLTAMPAANLAKPLRTYVAVDTTPRDTAAWRRFLATAATGGWQAQWDPATNVPTRIWGTGFDAPGASADPAIADQLARATLAAHLALLAPGAAIGDFTLVTNTTDGDIRSVGFVQTFGGRRVVGGQVSFRFKHDRLFVIASEALPDIAVAPAPRIAGLAARATTALRTALDFPAAPVTAPGDEVVLPLVADGGVLGYRIAAPITIDGGVDGKYLAYVDPATGGVLAVHQQNLYSTGTLKYRGVDRHPLRGRVDRIAQQARVVVGSEAQTTAVDGSVTFEGTPAIMTAVLGDLVEIVNKGATAMLASTQLTIQPGGTALWDASANGEEDAQVVTFLAVNTVKDYVRTFVDPALPGLDMPIKALVNIPKSCNAFYDGEAINFFAASQQCQNTGRIDDVVFHEFGHALHHGEVVEGVGRFDGAMSEGAADFLAAMMTGDSGMGRGLFYNEEPLRELDPPNDEVRWPEDVGEIHGTGRIFAGAFWDLRKALIAQYGATTGTAITTKLFVGALRRSTNIPTSFVEALASDDDDGNLDNGTPNECAIRAAFGRHGLRTATGVVDAPGVLTTSAATTDVTFHITGLSTRCPAADAIARTILIWVPSHTRLPAAGSIIMTETSPGVFAGTLPLPTDDVVYYSARVELADGSTLLLADNPGDRFYSLYQGETVPLYCTSFDDDPFAAGWRTATSDGSASPWVWAVPDGNAADPPAAFSGSHVLMQAGNYPKGATTYVLLPPIDIGTWSDVHLQYRRWLTVEDSEFDKARVMVDGLQAWVNGTASRGDSSSNHTIDREWRYHDVRVSGYAQSTTIDVGFELAADAGLQMGGWGVDDVCVVANIHSICGDGVISPTEACDDGHSNGLEPGACRPWCAKARCGDSIVDDKEECDDGLSGSAECTSGCKRVGGDDGGGCCSTSSSPSRSPFGALVLAGIVIGFVLRRRS